MDTSVLSPSITIGQESWNDNETGLEFTFRTSPERSVDHTMVVGSGKKSIYTTNYIKIRNLYNHILKITNKLFHVL